MKQAKKWARTLCVIALVVLHEAVFPWPSGGAPAAIGGSLAKDDQYLARLLGTGASAPPIKILITDTQEIGTGIIPENVEIEVARGGLIRYSGNLMIRGQFKAGPYQVFEKKGNASLSFGDNAVKEVLPEWWGARGDWNGTHGTDSTNALQAAFISTRGTVRLAAGTYRLDSGLYKLGVALVGEGYDHSIIQYYGTGTAMTLNTDKPCGQFRIESKQDSQTGLVLYGTHPLLSQVKLLEFDDIGLRVGSAGLVGAYYADINGVYIITMSRSGKTGILIDGGKVPSSNANILRNVAVKGLFRTAYHIKGHDNIFIGGDCELRNPKYGQGVTGILIEGGNNRFINPYFEMLSPGESHPDDWVHFTATAYANSISGIYFATGVPEGGINSRLRDEGWGNNAQANAIGYNFPFPGTNVSAENLLPNSGFESWGTDRLPVGWTGSAGQVGKETVMVRGSTASLRMSLKEESGAVACWVSTHQPAVRNSLNQVPVERLRGRTVLAGVWAKSSVRGLGNIKIAVTGTGGGIYGQAMHSGSGKWEFLTAMGRVPEDANEVAVVLGSNNNSALRFTGSVYFSEPIFVAGSELPLYSPRYLNDVQAEMAGRFVFAPPQSFPDGEPTPSVLDGNLFRTVNSRPTAITDFRGGRPGQEITVIVQDAQTTIAHNDRIGLRTGSSRLMKQDTTISFVRDGSRWYEK